MPWYVDGWVGYSLGKLSYAEPDFLFVGVIQFMTFLIEMKTFCQLPCFPIGCLVISSVDMVALVVQKNFKHSFVFDDANIYDLLCGMFECQLCVCYLQTCRNFYHFALLTHTNFGANPSVIHCDICIGFNWINRVVGKQMNWSVALHCPQTVPTSFLWYVGREFGTIVIRVMSSERALYAKHGKAPNTAILTFVSKTLVSRVTYVAVRNWFRSLFIQASFVLSFLPSWPEALFALYVRLS